MGRKGYNFNVCFPFSFHSIVVYFSKAFGYILFFCLYEMYTKHIPLLPPVQNTDLARFIFYSMSANDDLSSPVDQLFCSSAIFRCLTWLFAHFSTNAPIQLCKHIFQCVCICWVVTVFPLVLSIRSQQLANHNYYLLAASLYFELKPLVFLQFVPKLPTQCVWYFCCFCCCCCFYCCYNRVALSLWPLFFLLLVASTVIILRSCHRDLGCGLSWLSALAL